MKVPKSAGKAVGRAGVRAARAKPLIKKASQRGAEAAKTGAEAAKTAAETVKKSDFSKSAQRSLAASKKHKIPQAFADTGQDVLTAARKRPRIDRAMTAAENGAARVKSQASGLAAQTPRTRADAKAMFDGMKAKMPKNGVEAKEALGNLQTTAKRKASELQGKLGDVKRGSQDKANTTQKRVRTFAERQAKRVQTKAKVEGRGVAAELEGHAKKFGDMFESMKSKGSGVVDRGRSALGDVTKPINN